MFNSISFLWIGKFCLFSGSDCHFIFHCLAKCHRFCLAFLQSLSCNGNGLFCGFNHGLVWRRIRTLTNCGRRNQNQNENPAMLLLFLYLPKTRAFYKEQDSNSSWISLSSKLEYLSMTYGTYINYLGSFNNFLQEQNFPFFTTFPPIS